MNIEKHNNDILEKRCFSKNSISIYLYALKTFRKRYGRVNTTNVQRMVDDTMTSKKTIVGGMLKCIQCYDNKFPRMLKILSDAYQVECKIDADKRNYCEPSERELKTDFSYDTVKQKYEAHKQGKLTSVSFLRRKLYMCLLTFYPPQRNQVYQTTQISDNNIEGKNCIDLSKGVWNIREFKTDKHHEDYTIELNTETIDLIKEIKDIHKDWIYLIPSPKYQMMTQTVFSHFVKNLFGVGGQRLRSSYVSKRLDEGLTTTERKDVAKQMAHKVSTQILQYSKFSKVLRGKDEVHNTYLKARKKLGDKKLLKIMNALLEDNESKD